MNASLQRKHSVEQTGSEDEPSKRQRTQFNFNEHHFSNISTQAVRYIVREQPQFEEVHAILDELRSRNIKLAPLQTVHIILDEFERVCFEVQRSVLSYNADDNESLANILSCPYEPVRNLHMFHYLCHRLHINIHTPMTNVNIPSDLRRVDMPSEIVPHLLRYEYLLRCLGLVLTHKRVICSLSKILHSLSYVGMRDVYEVVYRAKRRAETRQQMDKNLVLELMHIQSLSSTEKEAIFTSWCKYDWINEHSLRLLVDEHHFHSLFPSFFVQVVSFGLLEKYPHCVNQNVLDAFEFVTKRYVHSDSVHCTILYKHYRSSKVCELFESVLVRSLSIRLHSRDVIIRELIRHIQSFEIVSEESLLDPILLAYSHVCLRYHFHVLQCDYAQYINTTYETQ